jgi:hypothetical protein
MKWLVLTLPENSKKAATISSYIKEQGAECDLFEVSYSKQNEPIKDFNYELLYNILKDTTHCIFFDLGKLDHFSNLMYIIGFLAGRQIPIFMAGKNDAFSSMFFDGDVFELTDINDFIETLKKYFNTYFVLEKKQVAEKKILERGMKVNANWFITVVDRSNIQEVQLFLDAGIDINSKNSKGIPALSVAVRNKNKKMVDWLIEHGASVNCISDDRGYSPVMDAVWKSNFELTKLLIDKGAFLDTIGKNGETILCLAVGAENEEISRLLFENGADPDTKDGMNMSARDYAKLFSKKRLLELFDSK